jgi:phosphohistidine phosphatase SixA
MELYLVRHAIAEERDPKRWPGDRERPLSEAGIAKFRESARRLAYWVPHVDAVWSSSLRRAWQTAEILSHVTGWPVPTELEALEPGRPVAQVLREVASHWRGERLALVGHAPGLDELAALALFGDLAAQPFALRKGGIACVAFEGPVHPGNASLMWLATPKLLRTLAH